MSDDRYVVKLASGGWLTKEHCCSITLAGALKTTRAAAYRLAAKYESMGAVALRLKPSARAAELAKLRAEVDGLRDACNLLRAERDALAAKLAALPPDVSDEEVAEAIRSAEKQRGTSGAWMVTAAQTARRLLRGPVAPARPVEELRDELEQIYDSLPAYLPGHKVRSDWTAVAKRARELGAR